jgi:hypothetical protein
VHKDGDGVRTWKVELKWRSEVNGANLYLRTQSAGTILLPEHGSRNSCRNTVSSTRHEKPEYFLNKTQCLEILRAENNYCLPGFDAV